MNPATPAKISSVRKLAGMFGHPPAEALQWVNELRIWTGVGTAVVSTVAAVLGGLTVYLNYAQIRLQADVSALQKAAAAQERLESDQRIAEANAQAAAAHERASQLESATVEARLEQERLRESNLAVARTLEAERSARLQLERQLGPRQILEAQGVQLIRSLSDVTPQLTVTVNAMRRDEEVVRYARLIAAVLHHAGVKVELVDRSNAIMMGAPTEGLYLLTPTWRRGDLLSGALRSAGFVFEEHRITENENPSIQDDLIIHVFPKSSVIR